jgi:hypothetical protein
MVWLECAMAADYFTKSPALHGRHRAAARPMINGHARTSCIGVRAIARTKRIRVRGEGQAEEARVSSALT